MKKNKTIAYMMAAMLLVGGTFLGTKALFTDSIDNVGEISISTGDLDIELEDANWVLDRNGIEHGDNTQNVDDPEGIGKGEIISNDMNRTKAFANNLKPGDVLTKTVKVTNKGTLAVGDLSVTENEGKLNLHHLSGLITVSKPQLGKTTLLPGESTTLTLKMTVENKGGQHYKEGENNVEGYNTDDIENSTVTLKDAWSLNATQQNPNGK